MIDWPADAEQIRATQDDPRWRTMGSGPFALVTVAYVYRDGEVLPFRLTHRFETAAARDEWREFAKTSGLRAEECE